MENRTTFVIVLAMSTIFALAFTYDAIQRKRKCTTSENFRIPVLQKDNFTIYDNNGAGDCLFYCFKQALESIGKNTSIKKLRSNVSKSMNNDKLETLKSIYLVAKEDRNYEMLKDYGFMRNVNTLDDLRRKIMTREYYGDDMAIAILEEYTGLNSIIISNGSEQIRLEKPKGNKYIVLILKNVHYRILGTDTGKLVFKGKPYHAIKMAKKKF
jgi:hypothetical protein